MGASGWVGYWGGGEDGAGFLCSVKIPHAVALGFGTGAFVEVSILTLRVLLWMETEAPVGRVNTMVVLFRILFLVRRVVMGACPSKIGGFRFTKAFALVIHRLAGPRRPLDPGGMHGPWLDPGWMHGPWLDPAGGMDAAAHTDIDPYPSR